MTRHRTDAFYVDRIRLLHTDPEQYFREYPRRATRAVRPGRETVPAHVAEKIDSLMRALVEANDGIEPDYYFTVELYRADGGRRTRIGQDDPDEAGSFRFD